MSVEVIAIGTELLLGQIVNSNAAHIGERLAEAGLDHYRQSVVGDNEERMAAASRVTALRAASTSLAELMKCLNSASKR